jgi:hypothetical protein
MEIFVPVDRTRSRTEHNGLKLGEGLGWDGISDYTVVRFDISFKSFNLIYKSGIDMCTACPHIWYASLNSISLTTLQKQYGVKINCAMEHLVSM